VLVELLLLQVAESAVPLGRDRSPAWASFDRCRRYIEENYLTLRTLTEVSAGCHLDKPYICRLFKRFGRETPYGMLMRLKMDRAAELLLHSNLMVKEIATAVGFDDPYHFSRVFKRVRGLSPTDFISLARHRLGA
jgi:AraC-like DNA-binding protein